VEVESEAWSGGAGGEAMNHALNVPRGGSVWRAVEVVVRTLIPRDERWSFAIRQ
jgi:hypothetical protein